MKGRQWFDSIWARAVEKTEQSPTFGSRTDVIVSLVEMQQELAQYEWTSKQVKLPSVSDPQSVSGATIRRLISYIIELCLEMSTITPYLPERVIQENIGMDRKTIVKALLALQDLGWIKIENVHTRKKGNTYRLLLKHARMNPPYLSHPMGCTDYGGSITVADVAFQPGGLNDTTRRILLQLSEVEGSPVNELCECLNLKADTARRNLNRMKDLGIVRKEDGVWFRRSDIDLEAVASLTDAPERSARRVENIARERNLDKTMRAAWFESITSAQNVDSSSPLVALLPNTVSDESGTPAPCAASCQTNENGLSAA